MWRVGRSEFGLAKTRTAELFLNVYLNFRNFQNIDPKNSLKFWRNEGNLIEKVFYGEYVRKSRERSGIFPVAQYFMRSCYIYSKTQKFYIKPCTIVRNMIKYSTLGKDSIFWKTLPTFSSCFG